MNATRKRAQHFTRPNPPSSSPGRPPFGFTLMETVLALVILAIGASVVLRYVRTLVLRAEHEQAHILEAMELLNEATRLPYWPKEQQVRESSQEGSGLYRERLTLTWPAYPQAPRVAVRNFSWRDEPLPPLDMAYTPGQAFVLEQGRYTYTRLAPALPPPQNIDKNVDKSQAEAVLQQDREQHKKTLDEIEEWAQKRAAQEAASPSTPPPPEPASAQQAQPSP